MNRANQQVVVQNANMNLIGIRQMEINYFITFFGTFGTQCFFLTAILAGSVSQTPSFDCAAGCNYFWQISYNVSVSISMVFTAICLLNAVFISVYAQGLGIRGEEGSMINAITGMIAEQTRIVQIFVVGIIFFMIQAIAMWFIVMDWEWAIVCAVIGMISSYYTYYCAVRIYNRFKWDFEKSGWNFDKEDDEHKELSELSPDVLEEVITKIASQTNVHQTKVEQLYRDSLDKGLITGNDSNEKKTSILLKLLQQSNDTGVSLLSSPPTSLKTTHHLSPHSEKSVRFEEKADFSSSVPHVQMTDLSKNRITKGYLQVLIDTSAMASSVSRILPLTSGPVWKKYYFILKGCYMFYYPDEKSYIKNASKPINARPIDLEGYKITTENMDGPFEFSLSPVDKEDIRKTWRFRCDGLKTCKEWIDDITKVVNVMKS